MNTVMTPEMSEVMETVHFRPSVSVIMPFEPKMSLKNDLVDSLLNAMDKVENDILEYYPGEMGNLVMNKLRVIVKDLNFNTYKKSIAIYVSPVFEKVLYLDMAVSERIKVDESFNIRDLLNSKKQLHQYLVLQLKSKESWMYLGNGNNIVKLVSNTYHPVNTTDSQLPEKKSSIADMPAPMEIPAHKFLRQIDNTLDIILRAYPLPLFVLGNEKTVATFKDFTKHAGTVIEFVGGNHEEINLEGLKNTLRPFVTDWKRVKQKDLLNQIKTAEGNHKLSVGMADVWHEAMAQKGRLLVAEKNYQYVLNDGRVDKAILEAAALNNKYSYIKDPVDGVMEKVLENGGDVELVEEGLLKDFNRIALVVG